MKRLLVQGEEMVSMSLPEMVEGEGWEEKELCLWGNPPCGYRCLLGTSQDQSRQKMRKSGEDSSQLWSIGGGPLFHGTMIRMNEPDKTRARGIEMTVQCLHVASPGRGRHGGVFTAREVEFLFSNFLCLFAYSSLNPVRAPIGHWERWGQPDELLGKSVRDIDI